MLTYMSVSGVYSMLMFKSHALHNFLMNPLQVFQRIVASKDFAKCSEKYPRRSFRPAASLKKLRLRYFPVTLPKFIRKAFL